jgi:hypothetical protein
VDWWQMLENAEYRRVLYPEPDLASRGVAKIKKLSINNITVYVE